MTGLSARRAALVRRLGGRFVVAAGTSATADSLVLINELLFALETVSDAIGFFRRARLYRSAPGYSGQVDNWILRTLI